MARIRGEYSEMSFVLHMTGSLIFLADLFIAFGGTYITNLAAWNSALLWVPLLFAAAVTSSIVLFIISFADVMWRGARLSHINAMVAAVAAVTLLPLMYGNDYFLAATAVGFALLLVGSVRYWIR